MKPRLTWALASAGLSVAAWRFWRNRSRAALPLAHSRTTVRTTRKSRIKRSGDVNTNSKRIATSDTSGTSVSKKAAITAATAVRPYPTFVALAKATVAGIRKNTSGSSDHAAELATLFGSTSIDAG